MGGVIIEYLYLPFVAVVNWLITEVIRIEVVNVLVDLVHTSEPHLIVLFLEREGWASIENVDAGVV